MGRSNTGKVQEQLADLGARLGFRSETEWSAGGGEYVPRYDVAWLIDLAEHFDLTPLRAWLPEDAMEQLLRLPFAGFEVEGTSTSSKNQLGNAINLRAGGFVHKFLVTCNGEANGENDTFRRALNILRTLTHCGGHENVFLLDQAELDLRTQETGFHLEVGETPENAEWPNFGNDHRSKVVFEAMRENLAATGLELRFNWRPEMLAAEFKRAMLASDVSKMPMRQRIADGWLRQMKPDSTEWKSVQKTSDMFYVPRIDMVLGFQEPELFSGWMSAQANALGEALPSRRGWHRDQLRTERFVPLLGIEIDSTANKHMMGSVGNLASFTHMGLLVAPQSGQAMCEAARRQMGPENVCFMAIEDILDTVRDQESKT